MMYNSQLLIFLFGGTETHAPPNQMDFIDSSQMSSPFTIQEVSTEHATSAPVVSSEKDIDLLPVIAERGSTISAQMETPTERASESERETTHSSSEKSSASSVTDIPSETGTPIKNPYPLTTISMIDLVIYCRG